MGRFNPGAAVLAAAALGVLVSGPAAAASSETAGHDSGHTAPTVTPGDSRPAAKPGAPSAGGEAAIQDNWRWHRKKRLQLEPKRPAAPATGAAASGKGG